jgi:hypothetical protein
MSTTNGKIAGGYSSRRFHYLAVVAFYTLTFSAPALAYPTSSAFVPSGETRESGGYDASIYTAMTLPDLKPAATWISGVFGISPTFAYGKGAHFGGVELGFSLLEPDTTGELRFMALFDAKIGALAEGSIHPAIAIGFIGFGTLPKQRLNMGYITATKTLRWHDDGPSYGRITAGMGRAFVPPAQVAPRCITSGENCELRGSFPFKDLNWAPMLGYETPAFGPLSFAIDHVGGSSALSSTNFMVSLRVVEGAYLSGGGFLSLDRRDDVSPTDGFFFSVSVAGNVKDLLKHEPPKAAANSEQPKP